MWNTVTDQATINLLSNNREVTGIIFNNDAPGQLGIRRVLLTQDTETYVWNLSFYAVNDESAYSFLSFFKPYTTSMDVVQFKLTLSTPDEKTIATALRGFVRKDPSFLQSARVIRDYTFVDFNEGADEPPAWFLTELGLSNGFNYTATGERTEQEPFHSIRFLLTDRQASLMASGGLIGQRRSEDLTIPYWYQHPHEENSEQFRRFLTGLNTPSITAMTNEILTKIRILTAHNMPVRQHYYPIITPAYATQQPLVIQARAENIEDKWANEFKRFTRLVHGVKTVQSIENIDTLSRSIIERNKTNGTYNKWFKKSFMEIQNADDLKFVAKMERYYQDFIHNNKESFKAELIPMLEDNIANLLRYSHKIERLENYSADEIAELRRKIMSKKDTDELLTEFTLLGLAKYWPINENDASTLEPIPDEFRVFVTEGHQHDIRSLIQFHTSRPLRTGETEETKKLLNPFTGTPIPEINENYIFEMAKTGNKPNFLKLMLLWLKYRTISEQIDQMNPRFEDMMSTLRIAMLEPEMRDRLIKNISDNGLFPYWIDALGKLGISIESIAALENPEQEYFVRAFDVEVFLKKEIDLEKLLNLSKQDMVELDLIKEKPVDELKVEVDRRLRALSMKNI